MKTNKTSHLLRICVFFTLLAIFSSCSDDTETTGTLRVKFANWQQAWSRKVSIMITPIEHEEKIIKKITGITRSSTEIELNPGNYHIYITIEEYMSPASYHKYAQVQAGKTEEIVIND